MSVIVHCQFLSIAYLFTLSVMTKFKFPAQNGESSRVLLLPVTNRKALAPGAGGTAPL